MSGITNPTRAAQIVDFDGMKRNTNWLTDIDGVRDWKGKAWVVTEVKSGNARMSFGQKLALTRLCDDLSASKPTLLMVARHNVPANKQVRLAECEVAQFYANGSWQTPNKVINAFAFETGWLEKEGLL